MKTSDQNKLKEIIKEGIMDGLTTQLSRQIVSWLKFYKDWSKSIPDLRISVGNLAIVVKFKQDVNLEKLKVTEGKFNHFVESLSIFVSYPSKFNINSLSSFIPELKNVLRHELEHYRQLQRANGDFEAPKTHQSAFKNSDGTNAHGKNLDTSDGLIDRLKGYYLEPREVEAYVMGAYKQAKTSKVPLATVLGQQLKKVFQDILGGGVSETTASKLAKEIGSAWMEYARNRLNTSL